MKINLSEYEEQPFPSDPQKQIISDLIIQLRSYINAPINELNEALPQLEALEKQSQDFDVVQGKPKISYIMEILAALHIEQKNERGRDYFKDDEESLFWKMAMVFKEKFEKIKTVGRTKFMR
jgi:hypothetical protein